MGNVDLHLIKGRPAVHLDDDLIVGHIAVTIDNERIEELHKRLQEMGIKFRTNVSVPNPLIGKPTKQVIIYKKRDYEMEIDKSVFPVQSCCKKSYFDLGLCP